MINAPITFMSQKEGYDIEAIKLLKPNMIFLLLDLAGNSGSHDLIDPIIKGFSDVDNSKVNFGETYKIVFSKIKSMTKLYKDRTTLLNLAVIILKKEC